MLLGIYYVTLLTYRKHYRLLPFENFVTQWLIRTVKLASPFMTVTVRLSVVNEVRRSALSTTTDVTLG